MDAIIFLLTKQFGFKQTKNNSSVPIDFTIVATINTSFFEVKILHLSKKTTIIFQNGYLCCLGVKPKN
jgi:hypothetical protein